MNSSTALQPLPAFARTPGVPRSPAGPTAVPTAGLRITRRGRLVLLGLVVALAFALISWGQVAAQAGPSGATGDAGPVSST